MDMMDASLKTEIEKLKDENEKLSKLVHNLLSKGNVYTFTNGRVEYVLSEEIYRVCKSEFKRIGR